MADRSSADIRDERGDRVEGRYTRFGQVRRSEVEGARMSSGTRLRALALLMLGALLLAPLGAAALEANSSCVGCHQTMSPGQASFDMPMPDKDVVCRRCHLAIFAGTHPIHNPGSNCNACHFNFGTSLINRVPRVVLSSGAFASVISTQLPSNVIHTIHAAARWPANVETEDSKCGSCHNVAACSACHGDIVHSTHAQHGASDPSTTSIGDPWTGKLSPGVTFGPAENTVLDNQMLRCGARGCHDTAGVATNVPDLMDCYTHPAYPDLGYVATAVTRSGTWTWLAGGTYTLRREIFSNYAGSVLNTTFNGEKVSIVSTTDPYRGIGRVFIDNVDMGTFDEYSQTTQYQRTVWTSPALSNGTHSLRVVVTGAKNPLARGSWVGYDNIEVTRVSLEAVAPDCGACHGLDHATNGSFCGKCHPSANGTYAGPSIFSATKHGATGSTAVARSQYPGTSYGAGSCANCHVDHTSTRAAGNQLCYDCHDATGSAKASTYSYQESQKYAESAHGSSAGAQACGACHAVHGASNGAGGAVGVALRSSEPRLCTGYSGSPGCHAQPANSAHGTNVLAAFEANAAASTHHDVFSGAAGHINCSSCHNPHLDTATTQTADPIAIGRPLSDNAARFRDASGNVYALVGAAHDGTPPTVTSSNLMYQGLSDTQFSGWWYSNELATSVLEYGATTSYGSQVVTRNYLTTSHGYSNVSFPMGTTWHWRIKMTDQVGNIFYSPDATLRVPYTKLKAGPTITGGASLSPVVVSWTTLGECDTWVDYGPTSAYGSTQGSSTYVTSHSVTLNLPAGVYHLRVRSSRDIDTYTSADYVVHVYPSYATAPTLTPVPSNAYMTGPQLVTFQWTQPNTTYAPFTYQLHVWDSASSPTYDYTSGWLSTNSSSLVLDGNHNYYWTVQAKDKDGTLYPLQSPPGSFYLYYYTGGSGSCPFLYTWDGEKYVFEADEFAAGKLGLDTKTGYRRPNPLDYHVIYTKPEPKDGALEYKLVEERAEVDYLDQLKLYTVEVPADREIWVERSQAEGVGTFTTLQAVIHTTEKDLLPPPAVKWVNTGEDVTAKITASDGDYLMLNEDCNNYTYQTLEMDLSGFKESRDIKLVMDGRTVIPTSIAGRELSKTFGAQVKFEVQDSSGNWVAVPKTTEILPKPPEYRRPFVLDLSDVWISDSRKVRFTYLFKTYFDSILIDTSRDVQVNISEVPLLSADLQPHGYDARDSQSEIFEYVYGEPASPPKYYLPGYHTKFGEVTPLLTEIDDKFVIFGGGDEITMRFQVPPAAEEGVTRRFLLLTDGYYKDLKQTIAKTVEPLPFAAMSNFPYYEPEHYPDDAEHEQYRAEWNTRYQAEGSTAETAVAQAEAFTARDVVLTAWRAIGDLFARLVGLVKVALSPVDETAVASAADEPLYSVDTDLISLSVLYASSSTAYPAQAGWQSAGGLASPPTPASPGTQVDSTTLNKAATYNSIWWRTDLTPTEGAYNWHLVRFNVPTAAMTGSRGLQINWIGHGEPTANHPVKLYLWDFQQSRWVAAAEGSGATNFSLNHTERGAGLESFCIQCHRSDPPAGASGASAFVNISGAWDSDKHGDGTGLGFGGGLAAPYARGASPIVCSVCHDSHGSSNVYHIKSVINGRSGISVTNGVQYTNACAACHTGTVAGYHEGCRSCHEGEGGEHWVAPYPNETWDCASCHKHGYTWVHPDRGCHGCGDPYGYAWRTF